MNKDLVRLYTTRCKKFIEKIEKLYFEELQSFDVQIRKTREWVKFTDRLQGEYTSINEGEAWGEGWDNAWFNFKGEIPTQWAGKPIYIKLNLGGESLLFDAEGEPVCGFAHASAFSLRYDKTLYPLLDKAQGGEKLDLWVETSASNLFGEIIEMNFSPFSAYQNEAYCAKVIDAKYGVFDSNVWHLKLDFDLFCDLIENLPEKSPRRQRIVRTLNQAIDAFGDDRANAPKAREIIQKLYECKANDSASTATSIGHAHIDTSWLWPVRESIRKTARTFSSQMELMDRYPQYKFGASQAQHYQFLKDNYPGLYQRLNKYIDRGQWEIQGGMWVEADCNLISGESMVRQFLYGKNFFKQEFDQEIKNLWLPDVFGYSAAMPQILKKCGIDYFLTIKISWSQFNKFPHNTFVWEGIDGSEVLTHFCPTDTYNGELTPSELCVAQDKFAENDILDEFLSVYGVGDGGGGPKDEFIERGLRQQNLEGAPKVKFDHAQNFFDRVEPHRDELEKWVGELYLELHRGTLTSQARVKKFNRMLENKLRVIENLYASTNLSHYPQSELDAIWQKVLINQFHDIIPGSSINETYRDTHADHDACLEQSLALERTFAERFMRENKESITLYNALSIPYQAPIQLDKSLSAFDLTDSHGDRVLSQKESDGLVIEYTIPANSFVVLKKQSSCAQSTALTQDLILENDLIRYEFNSNGQILCAFDKELGREVLTAGNILSLYQDEPLEWDAWDVDLYYENQLLETAAPISHQKVAQGPVRSAIEFKLKVADSPICQKVMLANNSKRLDFATEVQWNETHKMLRVAFDTTIKSHQATYDIQYGYVKRNTHRNTSWDIAKFEVTGHKYVDLSDNNSGVALLNDCKYGHKILDSTIDLNLLRAPCYPDPEADKHQTHTFTYSLLPHLGTLIESTVMDEAKMLNIKPLQFNNYDAGGLQSPVTLRADGISLEVVKKAQLEDALIVRLVEEKGSTSSGTLILNQPSKVMETNLIEWENNDWQAVEQKLELTLTPFEIRTYKIML